jgi:hypothetical protein
LQVNELGHLDARLLAYFDKLRGFKEALSFCKRFPLGEVDDLISIAPVVPEDGQDAAPRISN